MTSNITEPANYQAAADELLNSPCVHDITKRIIREGLERDCIDAYYDVKLALDVLRARLDHYCPKS